MTRLLRNMAWSLFVIVTIAWSVIDDYHFIRDTRRIRIR